MNNMNWLGFMLGLFILNACHSIDPSSLNSSLHQALSDGDGGSLNQMRKETTAKTKIVKKWGVDKRYDSFALSPNGRMILIAQGLECTLLNSTDGSTIMTKNISFPIITQIEWTQGSIQPSILLYSQDENKIATLNNSLSLIEQKNFSSSQIKDLSVASSPLNSYSYVSILEDGLAISQYNMGNLSKKISTYNSQANMYKLQYTMHKQFICGVKQGSKVVCFNTTNNNTKVELDISEYFTSLDRQNGQISAIKAVESIGMAEDGSQSKEPSYLIAVAISRNVIIVNVKTKEGKHISLEDKIDSTDIQFAFFGNHTLVVFSPKQAGILQVDLSNYAISEINLKDMPSGSIRKIICKNNTLLVSYNPSTLIVYQIEKQDQEEDDSSFPSIEVILPVTLGAVAIGAGLAYLMKRKQRKERSDEENANLSTINVQDDEERHRYKQLENEKSVPQNEITFTRV